MPRVTVLLPVHRPPALLPFAIETVLAQSVTDFELLVVCDGAPEETVTCARAFSDRDPRVRTFAFPKGKRHGEAHRHDALMEASGFHIAHISDDDLWFPNHLEEIERLLTYADFGHVIHTGIRPNGTVFALASDLAEPAERARYLAQRYNRFGPTFCAYRREAYDRLPEGWAPAPPGLWTDLNMWRKFLRRDDLTFASSAVVTAIHFAASERGTMSLAERAMEIRCWYQRIQDPGKRRAIAEQAMRSLIGESVQRDLELEALRAQLEQMTAVRDDAEAAFERMRSLIDESVQRNLELEALRAQLEQTTAARDDAEAAFERLIHSKSWRLTAPLRAINAWTKRRR